MKIEGTWKDLYVVGDIHGEFTKLVWELTQRHQIRDAVIILAGDCGFGFGKPGYYNRIYTRISGKLERYNLMLLCVRGNHDDPEYFKEGGQGNKPEWPRLKLIPDYTVLECLGRNVLCIGGATSTDSGWRQKWNEREIGRGSSRRVWWPTERPEQTSLSHIPSQIDIVVSHESPSQLEPLTVREGDLGYPEYLRICEDREYLGKVLLEVKPKYWFHGHYHKTFSSTYGQTLAKGLGIMEIYQVR